MNEKKREERESTVTTNDERRTTERKRPRTTLLTRHEGGYAAQGPGFFVWDRDADEVIRVAEALQAGRFVGSRSARFMMIEMAQSGA